MTRYMEVLADQDLWNTKATCVSCGGDKCCTPYGRVCNSTRKADTKQLLRVHVGGSVCVDVSLMGKLVQLGMFSCLL